MTIEKIARAIVEAWAKCEGSDLTWHELCFAATEPDEHPKLAKMHATAIAEAEAVAALLPMLTSTASYRAGAEDMRERAAKMVECGCDKFHGGQCMSPSNCAKDDQEAIRSLPLKEEGCPHD